VGKFLRCDPGWDPTAHALTGASYRLPADTDLTALAAAIQHAMGEGNGLTVVVESEDDPRSKHRVIINCATVHSVLLGETPEP
jgi:hypothetical protein